MLNNHQAPVKNLRTAREQRDVAFRNFYHNIRHTGTVSRPYDTVPGWFFYAVENLRAAYADLRFATRYSDFLKQLAKDQNVIFRS
jgi:hypothetical protein